MSGTASADLFLSYEVIDGSHILNGATVTSTATGNFTWESPTGFTVANQYAALNAPWSTIISGATGAGAVWNGTYSFTPDNANFPNIAVQWFSSNGSVSDKTDTTIIVANRFHKSPLPSIEKFYRASFLPITSIIAIEQSSGSQSPDTPWPVLLSIRSGHGVSGDYPKMLLFLIFPIILEVEVVV